MCSVNRLAAFLCVLCALCGKALLRDLRAVVLLDEKLLTYPWRRFYLEIPELSCFPVFTAQAMRGVLCAIPNLPRASNKIIPP